MFKYIFLFIIVNCSVINTLKACDGCNFFDYSTINNRSNIALVYSYRYFSGYDNMNTNAKMNYGSNTLPFGKVFHEPEENGMLVDKSGYDYESYATIQIRGTYNINSDWQISFILPFVKNEIYYRNVYETSVIRPVHDSTITLSGFSDPILLIDRLLIRESKGIRHTLKPGIGVKLPLGSTNDADLYDAVLLPGSGSTDLIFRMNYQFLYNSIGFNILPNYRLNGKGVKDYKAGNAVNLTFEPFYILEISTSLKIVPHGGLYFESRSNDFDDGREVQLSGGSNTFLQCGIDFKIKSFSFTNAYQKPIVQNLNGNQIQNVGRWNLAFLYNF